MNTIKLTDIKKVYHMGAVDVHALRGIDLDIAAGEFVAIMGASGSGKSTLMNVIGCLDYSSEGTYYLDGVHVNKLTKNQLADVRNRKIGFVFQGFNLLARTTALENVELPLLYNRSDRVKNPRKRAVEALERVGLGDRLDHESSQLSGGQQQRAAIARALVNRPAIVLADEPTGNLDTRTSIEVMTLFQELNRQGITIILVTHEPDIALYTKRIVELRDGLIIRDELVTPVLDKRFSGVQGGETRVFQKSPLGSRPAGASMLLDPFCTAQGYPMPQTSSQANKENPSMEPAGGILKEETLQ